MKTTYQTIRHTTVERVAGDKPDNAKKPARAKSAPIAKLASLEMIGDGETVLFDGIAPRSLVAQLIALVELHNRMITDKA